jgi:hypothetical protein
MIVAGDLQSFYTYMADQGYDYALLAGGLVSGNSFSGSAAATITNPTLLAAVNAAWQVKGWFAYGYSQLSSIVAGRRRALAFLRAKCRSLA